MKPIYHFVSSSFIAGSSFFVTQSVPVAVSTLSIGFLIDVDHLFDYAIFCVQNRQRPRLTDFLNSKYYPRPKRVYIPLHSIELILIIWLVALNFSAISWAIWLSLSMSIHLMLDYAAYHPYILHYSVLYRMSRGFFREEL